ncbi:MULTISPECIES: transposase [unclassified Streptomyces]|uniref:transposase n=1 Tax=Streptomyces sp. 1222.5 TaxID=1881026 RepID=UPI00159F9721
MDDDLWQLIEPLPPPWPERSPGPKPVDDRRCLQDILYVLVDDMAWQLLPLELGVRLRTDPLAPPWTAGSGPGAPTNCAASCSRSRTRACELDWTRAWVAPHFRAIRREPRPARHRSAGGKRQAPSDLRRSAPLYVIIYRGKRQRHHADPSPRRRHPAAGRMPRTSPPTPQAVLGSRRTTPGPCAANSTIAKSSLRTPWP